MGKLLYITGYILFRLYFFIFHRWEIKGKNNRPKKGPLIVVANHVSNLDPPAVGCLMNRQVYFLAKKELFSNPLFSWVLKKIGVISIKRGTPDRGALKKSLNILKNNKVLGLFPEGTRNKPGNIGKAKAGVILIALKSQSPILPVAIKNIKSNKQRTKVSIGKPFTLDQFYDKKLTREEKNEAGKLIMNKIKTEFNKINNI
ncbi:MAG: lysophospholipid acyltransferase family protein [Halanaerobiaceae bacterium]